MIKIKDIVKIKESDHAELIAHYGSSRGMSGLPKADVTKQWVAMSFDGSNLIATELGNPNNMVHLNIERFEVV